MTITNERTYRAADVVAFYTRASKLQPPEAAILSRVKSRSLAPRMLDLGVGGGRTTAHFSSIAKTYLGADYSAEMVRACTARFPHLRFVQADARAMPEFYDGSFDFVLFSHNGIDSVDEDGRMRALREVRRVLAPGGSFAFSTHNLNSCPALFFGSPGDGILSKLFLARRRAKVRAHNASWDELRLRDAALINDGAFQFRLTTFYIKPSAQIAHLVRAGFDRVQVFGLKTGATLEQEALGASTDPWLYYFCEVAARASPRLP
jgi:SAM-dependent methyltransferase